MSRRNSSRVFDALKELGLELEAPQDEFSYQPNSGGYAAGAIGKLEYGIDSDLDALGREDEDHLFTEDPNEPIEGESEWSQSHRFPEPELPDAPETFKGIDGNEKIASKTESRKDLQKLPKSR